MKERRESRKGGSSKGMSDQVDREIIGKNKKAPVPRTYSAAFSGTAGGSLTGPKAVAAVLVMFLMLAGMLPRVAVFPLNLV